MMENNFRYLVEIDWRGYTDCENNYCDDEGICRCYTINETWVKDIHYSKIIDYAYESLFPNNLVSRQRQDRLEQILNDGDEIIDKYGLWHLSKYHQLWKKENYNIEVSPGYYGEEIENVELHPTIYGRWVQDCQEFYQLETLKEKIFFLLEKEYGKVLDHLKDLTPKLVVIEKGDIDWKSTNPKHLELVKEKDCPYYSDDEYKLPRGIVRKVKNKYQIIDGYHRLTNTKHDIVEVYSFE